MHETGAVERVALGAAAGFAGTLALQVARTASERWLPQTMPPLRQDPGEFMVEQVEARLPAGVREQLPGVLETAAAKSLAVGYGLTAGALYALLRPHGGPVVRDGVVLGVGVWAAGYAGWLTVLGLMPPLREQRAMEVIPPMMRHGLFGIVTVTAYRWLRRRRDGWKSGGSGAGSNSKEE